MNSTPAHYSVVKFVPDELREEFVNIGVLLYSFHCEGESFRLGYFVDNLTRAFKLLKSDDNRFLTLEAAIRVSIVDIDKQMKDYELSLFGLSERYSRGIIQITTPKVVMVDDPHREIEDLRKVFLVEEPRPSKVDAFTKFVTCGVRYPLEDEYGIGVDGHIFKAGKNYGRKCMIVKPVYEYIQEMENDAQRYRSIKKTGYIYKRYGPNTEVGEIVEFKRFPSVLDNSHQFNERVDAAIDAHMGKKCQK